jgi:hypothetical protein
VRRSGWLEVLWIRFKRPLYFLTDIEAVCVTCDVTCIPEPRLVILIADHILKMG